MAIAELATQPHSTPTAHKARGTASGTESPMQEPRDNTTMAVKPI